MSLHSVIQAAQEAFERGEYGISVERWRSAVALAEASEDVPALDRAALLNGLGMACKGCGEFDEGLESYRRALGLLEALKEAAETKTARAITIEIASIYHNMGGLEHARGRCAIGEPMARAGLAMRERILGPNHVESAKDAAALAALLDGQGKFEESEGLHRRALEIFERELGGTHIETGIALGNLGALKSTQGKWDEAEGCYRRALEIKRVHLGDAHPSVGWTLNNLAVLERTQGRNEAAKGYFERALAILEPSLGVEHRRVVSCRSNYDSVCAQLEGA